MFWAFFRGSFFLYGSSSPISPLWIIYLISTPLEDLAFREPNIFFPVFNLLFFPTLYFLYLVFMINLQESKQLFSIYPFTWLLLLYHSGRHFWPHTDRHVGLSGHVTNARTCFILWRQYWFIQEEDWMVIKLWKLASQLYSCRINWTFYNFCKIYFSVQNVLTSSHCKVFYEIFIFIEIRMFLIIRHANSFFLVERPDSKKLKKIFFALCVL